LELVRGQELSHDNDRILVPGRIGGRHLRGYSPIVSTEVEPLQPHAQQGGTCASNGLLAASLPLLPRRFQLPVALREDLLLPPVQHAFRCDAPVGAVEADVVAVIRVSVYETPRIIERQRRSRSALADFHATYLLRRGMRQAEVVSPPSHDTNQAGWNFTATC